MKVRLYHPMTAGLSLLLSIVSTPIQAAVVNAEWIHNGSGNYSETAKWNVPVIPCNAGSTSFNIAIPESGDVSSSGTVSVNVPPCEVDTLTLGSNYILKVLAESDYTVIEQADISGTIHGFGGNFTASTAAFPSNRARAFAELGSTVIIGAPTYSSVGLPFSAALLSASDLNSLLDLSSMQSLDASFNDNSGFVRVHSITASNSATVNLSGLGTVTAPGRIEDRLDINVSGDAIINLSSLSTVEGVGQTKFDVASAGLLSLPILSTVSNGIFDVSNGSTLSATGTPWTYSSLGLPFSITLLSASDLNSLLDLSSMQSLDASFNDNSGFIKVHSITASNSSTINQSGLQVITTPVRSEDRIDFRASENANIDLSLLQSVTGNGSVWFSADGNSTIDLSVLNKITGNGQARINIGHATDLDLMGGEITIGALSEVTASTLINLKDFDSKLIAPGSLLLNKPVSITTAPDAKVNIGKDFSFKHTDETKLNLESAIVQFNGSGPQFVEAGGFDIGTFPPAAENFGFGQMIVGADILIPAEIIEQVDTESVASEAVTGATTVHLRDAVGNGNGHVLCGPGEEALYLLGLEYDPLDTGKIVNGLRILSGSTLVLDGIPLFVMQDGMLVDVRDLFGPTDTVIAYTENGSDGFIALGTTPGTDSDADGIMDIDDNCALVPNGPLILDKGGNSQLDTDGDGFGNFCDGDFNNNGIVDPLDFSALKAALGTFDPYPDLNCNGIVDPLDFSKLKSRLGQPPGPSCIAP